MLQRDRMGRHRYTLHILYNVIGRGDCAACWEDHVARLRPHGLEQRLRWDSQTSLPLHRQFGLASEDENLDGESRQNGTSDSPSCLGFPIFGFYKAKEAEKVQCMASDDSAAEHRVPPFASRDDRKAVEEGHALAPKFDEKGLITAVAQDATTNEILMVAYMNEESLRLTLRLGEAVYFSRSRQEIWHKGKTSGHVQKIKEIRVDCDQDCLLLKVEQTGPGCCHVGFRSCFYRSVPLAIHVQDEKVYQLAQAIGAKAYDPAKVYS